jgi:hypothetical protein
MKIIGFITLTLLFGFAAMPSGWADREGCRLLTEGTMQTSSCDQITRRQRDNCDRTWKAGGSTNGVCREAADKRGANCYRECTEMRSNRR